MAGCVAMYRIACTSFSPTGYETYGRTFLESFVEKWPLDIVVYYEEKPDFEHKRIHYRNLLEDPQLKKFLAEFNLPAAHGIVGKKDGQHIADYRLQCIRFAKKVFALTNYVAADWWIWIDADVICKKSPDEEFFSSVLPDRSLISYLGRDEWDHSECGFVGYRVGHPVPRAFLKRFREFYTSGKVFSLSQWHDSYVFDRVMDEFAVWSGFFHNISDGIPGNHVWPQTILEQCLTHNKGPELKREAYAL